MSVPHHTAGIAAAGNDPSKPPLSGPDRRTKVLADCLRRRGGPPERLLVVGCGSGAEAGFLARVFAAETVGVDLPGSNLPFDRAASAPALLLHMDAQRLAFGDDRFDMVYSFHALEHMADPFQALAEMRRVLRPGGRFCVGTPNSRRLLGYIGSDVPLSVRIRWNLHDLRMRLSGRWSNAAGAHAGYAAGELRAMCAAAFGDAEDISDEYYAALYPRHRRLLGLIRRSGAKAVAYPCVYVTGITT